jgi:DNA-directed RNA polymerase specialized sigma24 family protein
VAVDELLGQGAKPVLKREWQPTPHSFNRLLGWLDGGEDSQGRKYEEMRRRLISYFDRKDCPAPEELADETLTRVMKWLEENDQQSDPEPARICYQTAKFVFKEYLRTPDREQDALDDLPPSSEPSANPDQTAALAAERAEQEKRLACLEQCAQKLLPEECEMIIRYYSGEQRVKIENRRALAERLKISANALSVRACRIRNKLRACVMKCVNQGAGQQTGE